MRIEDAIRNGALVTNEASSAALQAGTTALTTTATAIAGANAVTEILLQADQANTADIMIGSASAQPIRLTPGQSTRIRVTNTNLVYAKAASGSATLNWLAGV